MRARLLIALVLVVIIVLLVGRRLQSGPKGLSPLWTPSPGVTLVPPPEYRQPQPNLNLSKTDLESNTQVPDLRRRADKILAGLKSTCANFRLNFGGQETFLPESGTISDEGYANPTIALESQDHRFEFDEQDPTYFSYISWYYLHVVIGKDAPFTLQPDTPKWSADQAIKVATAFLNVFIDPSKFIFEQPAAKYEHNHIDLRKYHEGTWTVTWRQLDDRGHPYAASGAKIELSEKWGVTDATLWLDNAYVEPKGKMVPRDVAIAIAKNTRPAMGTPSNDIIDYAVKSGDLMIVEPYGMRGRHPRLAWVIWLQPVRSPSRFLGYDDSQEVSVDAYTGQIIGNDAWALNEIPHILVASLN